MDPRDIGDHGLSRDDALDANTAHLMQLIRQHPRRRPPHGRDDQDAQNGECRRERDLDADGSVAKELIHCGLLQKFF
jgi:hypothetical protein